MKADSLHDLYIHNLQDLYSAEEQLIEALPNVIKSINDSGLKSAVQDHLAVTKEHSKRLKQIFTKLDEKPGEHVCKAMKGLIKEGEDTIKDCDNPQVLDAAIIGAAQRIEHYEIAGYGTAYAYAEQLGYEDHCELLQATLDEEKQADESLSDIASNKINPAAVQESAGATTTK
jgi:ferritin-like metal-binding protein YciE